MADEASVIKRRVTLQEDEINQRPSHPRNKFRHHRDFAVHTQPTKASWIIMNFRPAINQSLGPVAFHVGFNNDSSAFSVALKDGFIMVDTKALKPYGEKFKLGRSVGQVALMESLNGRPSNYVGIISGGLNPMLPANKFALYDIKLRTETVVATLADSPLGIRLTTQNMISISRNVVRVYEIDFNMKKRPIEKIAFYETTDNPLGLGCLGRHIIIFPGRNAGQIQIVNLRSQGLSIVPAHQSTLRALALSPDEEFLASASEKGTLVRLYSTVSSQFLGEFRRGIDRATIFSMAISPSSAYLGLTSDKSTLHIFSLPQLARSDPQDAKSPSPVSADWQDVEAGTSPSQANGQPNLRKWGGIANVPLAPKFFSDVYSLASAPCNFGDDYSSNHPLLQALPAQIEGLPGGKPPKGVLGWINDQQLAVLSAGRDPRYEKFSIVENEDGKTACIRSGWVRLLK